jgi:hypothetical protein
MLIRDRLVIRVFLVIGAPVRPFSWEDLVDVDTQTSDGGQTYDMNDIDDRFHTCRIVLAT